MRSALLSVVLGAFGFLGFLHLSQHSAAVAPIVPAQAVAVVISTPSVPPTNPDVIARAASSLAMDSPNPPAQLSPTTGASSEQSSDTPAASTVGVVLGTSTEATYVTENQLEAALAQLQSSINFQLYSSTTTQAYGGVWNGIAETNRIDNLSGSSNGPLTISDATLTDVSGLTASEIPSLSSLNGLLGIVQGGTGTSTAPGADQLMLSDANGNWEYVATSSLGITNGGGTFTSIGPAGQTQTGPAVTLATSTNTVNGLTSALTITAAGDAITFAPSLSGTLSVAGGGTGWSSIAAGAIPYGNGSSALATTTAGTDGYVLAYLNGVPTWTATSTLANISGTLAVNQGGTGDTAFSSGQLLYGNGTSALSGVATSSLTAGTGVTFSGTPGTLVGGTALIINTPWTVSGTNIYNNNSGSVGIGTSSPWGELAISANNGSTYPGNNLFAIASTSPSETDTLLSFNNTGQLTLGQNILPAGSSTQLSVLAGTTTLERVSSNTLNASGRTIYVQGRYAYIADFGTTNAFEVWDVSNPAAPVRVSQSTLNATGFSIYVQGRYAYLADLGTTNAFEVWDISNPAAPVRVSQSTLNASGRQVYVQGRYAYIADGGTTNAFEVWDVSNPAAPVRVSQSTLNASGIGLYVQGRYAYIAGQSTTNGFEVWDVSNPAAPVLVSQSTLNASGRQVYVQGRYAYIADQTATNGFEVWDVSNPASPVRVSSNTLNAAAGIIYVQGRYAYIADSGTTNAFEVWDVSNPAAPVRVSQNTLNATGFLGLYVQGRYAYFADNTTTNGFEIWDLGGAYIQQLETGGLETGTLDVRNNLQALDGSFSGGLNVGASLDVTGSASVVSATSTYNTTANIFNIATASSTNSILSVRGNGNVGIGTANPYSPLQVTGPDAASSTSAFAVANSASTTVFAVFDGGNAELSGTLTQNSDQRLKTNIQSLDVSSSLSLIDALNPVTFNWIDPSEGSGTQVGFIAQQVQQIFPELVSTTSATALTPGGTLGLNYIGLISPIVSAIQALSSEVQSLIAEVQGFTQKFTTNELCVNKSDGAPVCVTGDQLATLLAAEGQQTSPASPTVQTSDGTTTISDVSSTTPPTVTINGNNPAIIQVGESYADLGVTISDNGPGQAGGMNLGYQTFFNGTLVSNIVIDTSEVATDTIDYVATDSDGLTATSTRTVLIEPGAASSIVPTDNASTTASSTAQ